jgi:N-acetylglucosamine-6-sulfatase
VRVVSRRQVLAGLGATAGVAAVGTVAARRLWDSPSTESPRHSVVVVLVDDMRFDYRGLLETFTSGPWIDCTGAAAQTAICAPSRASLLTGSNAWRTPVVGDPTSSGMKALEADTVATRLRAAGYRTALVGKYQNQYPWDLGAEHVPPGWTDWAALHSSGWNPRGLHETDHCFAWAADFVRSAPADQPFFLWVATQLPHDPYTPPERYVDAAVEVPPTPPNFDEEDVSTKPPFLRNKPRLSDEQKATYAERRKLQAQDMLAIDDGLRVLVDALHDAGRWDSTAVIFTSDNSLMLGEHRLENKGFPYEESVHVPFVVRLPGVERREEPAPISLVDLPATVCAIAGQHCPGPDGVSLLPLITRGQAVREGAYLTPPDRLTWEGVRTAQQKYVEYTGGFRELYDLREDPYELVNLAGRRDRTALQHRLEALLADLRR